MSTELENKVVEQPKLGEIYLMKFSGIGSEQKGYRPGLVFQNNTGNAHSPNIIALPLTTSLEKASQPTHVFLPADYTGLERDSIVLCESPQCMSKERIRTYITTLPDHYMKKIAVASLLASSAISFIDPDVLLNTWKDAVILNQPKSEACIA